jgi:hypothetical protein
MHENRETSSVFPHGDRSGKAERRTPDVYAGEESDRGGPSALARNDPPVLI